MLYIKSLTEEQFNFVKQYIELLNTMEAGFELVESSYQERNFGSGDKLLKDIVGAFVPFNASNLTIRSIFTHDSGLTAQLDEFSKILEKVLHLEEIIDDQDNKIVFIHDSLFPAYKQWKDEIEKILQVYVVN